MRAPPEEEGEDAGPIIPGGIAATAAALPGGGGGGMPGKPGGKGNGMPGMPGKKGIPGKGKGKGSIGMSPGLGERSRLLRREDLRLRLLLR